MGLPANRLSRRMPKRFPVGATYVVEGRNGAHGVLRVLSRYVLLPDGKRIDVPVDLARPLPPRAPVSRRQRNPKQSRAKSPSSRGRKKIAVGGGTK
jgi:hypothetical protein